jgi:hypothetical protein
VTFDQVFPEDECVQALSELNAWTSVQNICSAGRALRGAPADGDQFERLLIIPFEDDEALEAALLVAVGWLIKAYRVSEPKLKLAGALDLDFDAATRAAIAAIRFMPNVSVGAPALLARIAPHLAHLDQAKFLLIEDEPHIIELVQAPLRCLGSRLSGSFDTAKTARAIRARATDAGDEAPLIYHRPRADSPLPAVLEALCFWFAGLAFGPKWSTSAKSEVDIYYRAINIVATPPVDPRFVGAARGMAQKMLSDLK